MDSGLANIGNQVLLESAWARVGGSVRLGLWDSPLTVRPGQVLHLRLTWRPRQALNPLPVHPRDRRTGPCVLGRLTPLGGAFPSYLWFPQVA